MISSFAILSIFLGLAVLYVLLTGRVPGSPRGGNAGYTRAENPRGYWFYVGMMIVGAVVFYFIGT